MEIETTVAGPVQLDNCPHKIQKETATLYLLASPICLCRKQVCDTEWSCPAYVPVSQLIYAAFRSKAKGLLPPNDEWRRRGL